MVTVTELNRAPDISANAIDAATVSAKDGEFRQSFTDPSGTVHDAEIADATDLVTNHDNLTNVQPSQHHEKGASKSERRLLAHQTGSYY